MAGSLLDGGLMEATAKELFNQAAKMTIVDSGTVVVDTNKVQYHTIIRLELQNRSRGGGLVSGKSYNPNKPRIPRHRESVDKQLREQFAKSSVISVEDQTIAYPYHMLLDESMFVVQCGESLRELVQDPITTDTNFTDFATISLPILCPTSTFIRDFIHSVYFISIKTGDYNAPFVLKGQFSWLPNCSCLLFIGSPHLLSWSDFKEMNVCMADIPLYDCTRELVLLNQQRIAEIDVAKRLDESTIEMKRMSRALEAEKQKTEELLHEMMPRKVATQLTLYGQVKAERYESCTVLFSDVVTFTNITAQCQADQVVNMLNDMYHRFDTRSEAHGVYKVETIGDAYMAVTGVPEEQEDHAERMADFSMDMLEEAARIPSPATGQPLQVRVGFHTGSVVAGVIGKKKPRYDIYGETVGTASLMESSGSAGRIHVSEPAFQKLYSRGYVFKSRGEIEIKSKEKVLTYFLVGTQTRIILQPNDHFSSLPDVLDPDAEPRSMQKTSTSKQAPAAQTLIVPSSRASEVRKSIIWQNLLGQNTHTSSASKSLSKEAVFMEPRKAETKKSAPQHIAGTSSAAPSLSSERPQGVTFSEVTLEKTTSQKGILAQFLEHPSAKGRRSTLLRKIEPSASKSIQKMKRRASQAEKAQLYTTEQMRILPIGPFDEDSELHSGSFFDKSHRKKSCSIL